MKIIYSAYISKNGINDIKSRLKNPSEQNIQRYSKMIIYWINKYTFSNTNPLIFKPISTEYKKRVLSKGRLSFENFKNDIFIPYTTKEGCESYSIHRRRSKMYRLNLNWVSKYVRFRKKEIEIKDKKREKFGPAHIKADFLSCLESVKPNFEWKEEHIKYIESAAKTLIGEDFIRKNRITFIVENPQLGEIEVKLNYNEIKVFDKVLLRFKQMYLAFSIKSFNNNKDTLFRNIYEHRVYHKMTFLPKVLYPFFNFNGESIHEIDISNCFPMFIISAILKNRNPYNLFLFNRYADKFRNDLYNDPICRNSQLVTAIETGKFYDFITNSLFPNRKNENYLRTKSYVKGKINEVLFGKYNSKPFLKSKLIQKFPDFIKAIDLQKKQIIKEFEERKRKGEIIDIMQDGKKTIFKAGNDAFAILGMRHEANLVIDKILPKMYENSVKVISKHDAILCPESDKEIAYKIMFQIMTKEYGNGNFSLHEKTYHLNKLTISV